LEGGDTTIGGRLKLFPAVSKIIAGTTSFSVRKNDDTVDNLLVTDAGNTTVRGTLTVSGATASLPATTTTTLAATTGTFSGLVTANAGISVPTGQNVTGAGTAQVTGFATISGTTLTGTLSTAAQPNVTSVGTLSSLTVSGALVANGSGNNIAPSFVSGQVAIGAAGTTTISAHGLGVRPRFIEVTFQNVTAELGYSVGDEVPFTGASGGNAASIYVDATNIGFVFQTASTIAIVRRDTFAIVALTNANWRLVFKAWR
jgi:hypothetical protein